MWNKYGTNMKQNWIEYETNMKQIWNLSKLLAANPARKSSFAWNVKQVKIVCICVFYLFVYLCAFLQISNNLHIHICKPIKW